MSDVPRRGLDPAAHDQAARRAPADEQTAGPAPLHAAALQRKIQRRALQRRAANQVAAEAGEAGVHEAAARGTAGPGGALPHRDAIQRAFGRHDVGHVEAHTDGAAAEAARDMGAEAFATGDHVAFAGAPSLHTAAHEAAHVVQQRGGVQLRGGVGADGDTYERHADQVADAVVAGRSAEGLLDRHAGAGPARQADGAIQLRSTNPKPSSTTGTPVPLEEGATLAEHHIIPHNLLEKFWKAAGKLVDETELIGASGAVLGEWGDVQVKELTDSKVLKAEWFDDDDVVAILGAFDVVEPAKVADVFTAGKLDQLKAKPTVEACKKLAMTVPFTEANWGHAKTLSEDPTTELGDEVDLGNLVNLVAPYYEWMPGNLVVGPEGAVRANDPKEKYDTEAATALPEAHAACLKKAFDDMTVATGTGGKPARTLATKAALAGIRSIGTTYGQKIAPPIKQGEDDEVVPPCWVRGDDGWSIRLGGGD